MKDFLDNELNVGDEVVFVQLNYRNLLRGTIKTMSKCMINIEHAQTNTLKIITRQMPSQVIKVN